MKFLYDWFKSKDDSYEIYSPKERLLYQFYNGEKVVKADPLVLYRALQEVGPELNIDMKVATSPLKDASKAHVNMVKTIHKIFKTKPLEEGGLTELETVALLDHFLTFCGRVKKNSRVSATTSPLTEESKTISKENPPISSSSDSGSTAEELSIELLASSPTEPALPLEGSNLP